MTRNDIQKLFQEPRSLVDLLPYAEYAEGVFIQVDGSLGRIWEIEPLKVGCLGEEALGEIVSSLSGFIAHLPAEYNFQFLLCSDGAIESVLKAYEKAGIADENAIVARIMAEKMRHMLNSKDGFFKGETFAPRRLRVFFTARYIPVEKPFSFIEQWRSFLLKEERMPLKIARQMDVQKSDFLRVCASIEGQWQSLRLGAVALNDDDMVALLYGILNPKRSNIIAAREHSGEPLRDQVLYNAPQAEGPGFVFDGYHTRVVSLKELPSRTVAGMFSADTADSGGECLLDILNNMMVVINCTVPEQTKALERLKFQKTFAFIQRASSSGNVSEEAVHQKEELSALITETFKSGKAIVYARAHIVLFSASAEEADRACDALLSALHRFGAEGLKEEIIAPSLFLTCLPLNFDHTLESVIRRTKRLLSDNFADMLPVYGAFRSTPTPAAMYLNRRGEPVFVDLFDSATNPHAVIIGASGAGKSFLTNDLIYQNYRLGSYFFVLDKGHSYRKTCEVLNGQYVSFEMDKPLRINPFYRKPTAENQAFLVEMLAMMASGGDERDRLGREERG
ncbi:MAG: TraC family protein, partial [Candidatus Omnitrophica bacterium]|nr:TraC family protein [Candidatus Omnitrophota bacterium]